MTDLQVIGAHEAGCPNMEQRTFFAIGPRAIKTVNILANIFILFSNENGTRYEADFSFWLTGMERGVAALR